MIRTLLFLNSLNCRNTRPHVYVVEAQLSLCTDVDSQCCTPTDPDLSCLVVPAPSSPSNKQGNNSNTTQRRRRKPSRQKRGRTQPHPKEDGTKQQIRTTISSQPVFTTITNVKCPIPDKGCLSNVKPSPPHSIPPFLHTPPLPRLYISAVQAFLGPTQK